MGEWKELHEKSREVYWDKGKVPLCFARHTHYDRMKIRALCNIHPGSCNCKNTFFWYVTCVVWETFTEFRTRQNMAVAGSSKRRYISIWIQCLIVEDGTLQRLVRTHIKAVQCLIQILGKVTRKGCKQVGIISYEKLPKGEQSRVYPKLITIRKANEGYFIIQPRHCFSIHSHVLAGRFSELAYWTLQHNSM
jgi:hypothetical protein